jgi:hypothetical protein
MICDDQFYTALLAQKKGLRLLVFVNSSSVFILVVKAAVTAQIHRHRAAPIRRFSSFSF